MRQLEIIKISFYATGCNLTAAGRVFSGLIAQDVEANRGAYYREGVREAGFLNGTIALRTFRSRVDKGGA